MTTGKFRTGGDYATNKVTAELANQNGVNEEGVSLPWWWKWRQGAFRALHDIAEDANVNRYLLLLLWTFDLMQILAIPTSPTANLPWISMPIMRDYIFLVIEPAALLPGTDVPALGSTYNWIVIWLAVIVLTATYVACFAWLTYAHAGYSSYKPRWMVSFFRIAARVSLHGFYVPLTAMLTAPFSCYGDVWFHTTTRCWSGGHIGMVIITAILLPFCVGFNLTMAGTFIDRNADTSGKKNLLAVSHGRVDLAMQIVKLLAVAYYVFAGESASGWGLVIVSLLSGCAWLYAYIQYLPYWNNWLNQVQCAFACIYIAAGACAGLALGIGFQDTTTAAVAWLAMLPTAAYAGWALADLRWQSFGENAELTSPYMAELRARWLLLDGIARGDDPRQQGNSNDNVLLGDRDQLYDRNSSGNNANGQHSRNSSGHARKMSGGGGGRKGGLMSGSHNNSHTSIAFDDSKDGNESHRSSASAASGAAGMDRSGGTRSGGSVRSSSSRSSDFTTGRNDTNASPTGAAVDDLYRQACSAFMQSPIMHIFAAHHQGVFNRNQQLERMHLRVAEERADSTSFDILFFTWSRRLMIQQVEEASGRAKMSVDRRVTFERLLNSSRLMVMQCRQLILGFWTALAEKRPDLTRMQGLGAQINSMLAETDMTFRSLLELAPQSAPVMRQYADFLLELANDPRKAMELLTDAEQIEDDQSRNHSGGSDSDFLMGGVAPDFDLCADSVALVRVANDAERLGQLTAFNNSALKLFGYSRREVLGKNIAHLIPEPIASVHQRFLDTFAHTGHEKILGRSRLLFGLHRSGHIFPLSMNIRASEADFAAVFEPHKTALSFIFFLGEKANWRVTAVCHSSMALLGMDPVSMRGGAVTLSRFVSDVVGTVLQLQDEDGGLVIFRNVADTSSTDDGTVTVTAKIQQVNISHLTSPLYILRWKRASAVDTRAVALRRQQQQGGSNNGGSKARSTGALRGSDGDDHDAAASDAESVTPPSVNDSDDNDGDDNGDVGIESRHLVRKNSMNVQARGRKAGSDANSQRRNKTSGVQATPKPSTASASTTATSSAKQQRRSRSNVDAGDGAALHRGARNNAPISPKGSNTGAASSTKKGKGGNAAAVPTIAAASTDRSSAGRTLNGRATSIVSHRSAGSHGTHGSHVTLGPDPDGHDHDAESSGRRHSRQFVEATAALRQGEGLALRAHSATANEDENEDESARDEQTPAAVTSSAPDAQQAAADVGIKSPSCATSFSVSARNNARSALSPLSGSARSTGSAGSRIGAGIIVGSSEEGADVTESKTGDDDGAGAGVDGTAQVQLPGAVDAPAPAPAAVVGTTAADGNLGVSDTPGRTGGQWASGAGNESTATADPTRSGHDSRAASVADAAEPEAVSSSSESPSRQQQPPSRMSGMPPSSQPVSLQLVDDTVPGAITVNTSTSVPKGKKKGSEAPSITTTAKPARSSSSPASAAKGRYAPVPLTSPLALPRRTDDENDDVNDGDDQENHGRVITDHSDVSASSKKKQTFAFAADQSKQDGKVPKARMAARHGRRDSKAGSVDSGFGRDSAPTTPKAGSVHSKGSSRHSGGSAMSASAALRRGVQARGARLESSLLLLKRAIILVFVITAALNLSSLVLTLTLSGQLKSNINLVDENGVRVTLVQRIYSNVLNMLLGAEGKTPVQNITATAQRNLIYLSQLEDVHRSLYMHVDSQIAQEVSLYTVPSIPVEDLVPGTYVNRDVFNATSRNVALADGIVEFVARSRRILTLNGSQTLLTNPDVFWVMQNGASTLRTALNNSMFFADQRSDTQATIIGMSDMIFLAASEGVFVLMTIAVMVPAVMRVLTAKTAIFEVFIEVPLPIIKSLRASVYKRILAIAKADDEAAMGIDIGGKGEVGLADDHDDANNDQGGGASPTDNNNNSGGKKRRRGSLGDDDEDDVGLTAAVNAAAAAGSGKGKGSNDRTYRRAASQTMGMLLRMMWPIGVYMIYFGGVFVYKQSVISLSVQQKNEVLWSQQAAFYLRMADIRLRGALTYCEPVYASNRVQLAHSNIDFFNVIQDQLMYGAAERNTRPGLQVSGPTNDLMLKQSCLVNDPPGWYYDVADCQSYASGLMTNGLLAGFREYSNGVTTLANARANDIGSPTCTHMDVTQGMAEAVHTMASTYLANGFTVAANIRVDDATSTFETFTSTITTVTVVSVVALVVLFYAVYRPQIDRLDREIKNVRLLLLLFPDEVSASVPSIVNAGREMLTDAGSVLAGSTR